MPRFIIFKFDDFVPSETSSGIDRNFARIVEHAINNKMNVSFGVIVKYLEAAKESFCEWVRVHAIDNGGFIEFWHHGYDHGMGFMLDGKKMIAEFSGPDYIYQSENFQKAMNIFKIKTSLTFHTFGAPGNALDETTLKVIEEQSEIKVWLYGNMKAQTTKLVLGRPLNLEHEVGKIDVAKFIHGYESQKTNECLVLQGHPPMWREESWVAYTQIVEILKKDQWEFVTPMQFYEFKKNCCL